MPKRNFFLKIIIFFQHIFNNVSTQTFPIPSKKNIVTDKFLISFLKRLLYYNTESAVTYEEAL